jgi:hypothetical protein
MMKWAGRVELFVLFCSLFNDAFSASNDRVINE